MTDVHAYGGGSETSEIVAVLQEDVVLLHPAVAAGPAGVRAMSHGSLARRDL